MTPPSSIQPPAAPERGNVLVSAGAGTGKTTTLVRHCLTLLAGGASLENILMVTFTEAAAVEMRSRIREALKRKVTELESGAEEDRSQLEHFQKQLLLLDTALISTLHSFCLQLVRENFHELGIDPDVTVLNESQAQPLIQQSLEMILERHYGGESEFDRAVQTLVRAQGRGADDRIRALILKLHRYSQARDNPQGWLDQQRALFRQTEPVQWREWFIEAFTEWRQQWLPVLQPLTETRAVALCLAALQRVPTPPEPAGIGVALAAICAADQTDDNWPRGTKTRVRNRIDDFFDEARFLASLTVSGPGDPMAEDWELIRHDLRTLLDLVAEFTAEFAQAKRELGGADFADLEQLALRALRDPPTAIRWQQRLERIFVDEYQDINAVQDAILCALSRGGPAANRFLVGDVKQSIYRFRLADPTIFRSYETRWSAGAADSKRVLLSENFRSRPGILDFINTLFHMLMREDVGGVAYEELKFGNAQERAQLAGDGTAEPRVELHLITRSEASPDPGTGGADDAAASEVADLLTTEREARLVALRLCELKAQRHEIWDRNENRFRPVRWSDMAVLLRSPAGRVEALAQEFSNLGIPLEAARGGFFESLEIRDLVSLLQLLDNPLQDIPLLAVLRSPLVGLTPAGLGEIRAAEAPDRRSKYFWLAARHFHAGQNESNPVWRRLDSFFKQLARWRERVRHGSLSICLEAALNETHYESLLQANPRGAQQIANVRRLVDLARDYDPYQRQGLFRFLRFVAVQEEMEAELEPMTVTRDAVQLMSIHRSKGLEFPVVVLSGLGGRFNERDLHENILVDEHFGLCPKILPPGGGQSYPSLPHWLAQRRQQKEMLGEELRLLYVAMTRARDTLVLTGTSNKKEPWGRSSNGGNEPGAKDERRRPDARELLSARRPLDWLGLWLAQVTRDADWKNDRAGGTQLLRWTLYAEDDARLESSAATSGERVDPTSPPAPDEHRLEALRARVAWTYPFPAAIQVKAKTSVTELRRLAEQEEAEPAPFARPNRFRFAAGPRGRLSAAEIGLAHHRFMQRVDLARVGTEESVRAEAERLHREGWLDEREMASLDFEGLAHFWHSDLGRRVVSHAALVRRELQFTTRFEPEELALRGAGPVLDAARTNETATVVSVPFTESSAGEFVVVQGVVDLAVILPREIWLIDFKTDETSPDELKQKMSLYEPQLTAYARALERIYGRPVNQCWLHFISLRTTRAVEMRHPRV